MLFWKADYEKIEQRLCALCAMGDEPKKVTYVPVMELVQVKFPRSKKKRIRKKWAQQSRNLESRMSTWMLGADLFSEISGNPHKFEHGAKLELGCYGGQGKG